MTTFLLRPQRHAGVQLTTLDDETLMYHPDWRAAFALNATAFSIWQLCDGERTVGEIVELLQKAYPDEATTMPSEVEAGVRTLSQHGIVRLPRRDRSAATYDVELGGAALRLEADDAPSAEILDRLCAAMASEFFPTPSVTFRLGPGADPDSLAVYRDDAMLYYDHCLGTVATILLEKVQDHVLHHSTSGSFVHAAAVARDGRSMLLAGKTGAGKTTLATWLVRRGFDYLTDELAWIRPSGLGVHGFARPLHLKTGARHLFGGLFDNPGSDAILDTPIGHQVSPLRLGCSVVRDARPSVLIFPSYGAGARFDLRRLSKAQGAARLMGCLVNARERVRHGVDEIARLVQSVSAYSMTYSDLDQAGRELEAVFALPGTETTAEHG